MKELVHFNRAKKELVLATDIDEVKEIRDKAEALRIYAKQAGESLEMQNQCAEIKIRAERRAGELLGETVGHSGGSPLHHERDLPKGISEIKSHRWQKIANIPEGKFEEHITKVKNKEEELTTAGLLRFGYPYIPSSVSQDEWETPDVYIHAIKQILGEIDFDPATNESAQERIQAEKYYIKEHNALDKPWKGKIWLNPPYSYPLVEHFINKLIKEYEGGNVTEAILVVNNATDTRWFIRLSKYLVCFTKGRINFWDATRKSQANVRGQAFVYLGKNQKEFIQIFSKFAYFPNLRLSENES